jgi:hypothetical protein
MFRYLDCTDFWACVVLLGYSVFNVLPLLGYCKSRVSVARFANHKPPGLTRLTSRSQSLTTSSNSGIFKQVSGSVLFIFSPYTQLRKLINSQIIQIDRRNRHRNKSPDPDPGKKPKDSSRTNTAISQAVNRSSCDCLDFFQVTASCSFGSIVILGGLSVSSQAAVIKPKPLLCFLIQSKKR